MDVTIEVKWSKEDIVEMLRSKMKQEGMLPVHDPKKQCDPDEDPFIWPKKGGVLVRVYAKADPDFQTPERMRSPSPVPDGDDDEPKFDPEMFPDDADVDALQQIEEAARAEERGEGRRPMHPGESRERPPRKS